MPLPSVVVSRTLSLLSWSSTIVDANAAMVMNNDDSRGVDFYFEFFPPKSRVDFYFEFLPSRQNRLFISFVLSVVLFVLVLLRLSW